MSLPLLELPNGTLIDPTWVIELTCVYNTTAGPTVRVTLNNNEAHFLRFKTNEEGERQQRLLAISINMARKRAAARAAK